MLPCAADSGTPPNWSCCALYRVTRFLRSTLEWDEVVEEVLDLALAVTRARRALLVALPAGDDAQHNASADAEVAGVRGMTDDDVADAGELCRRILTQCQRRAGAIPVLEGDLARLMDISGDARASRLCLPLHCGRRCVGVLWLDDPDTPGLFPTTHSPFYAALAEQLASALHNARRYTDLQREIALLRQRLSPAGRFADILGDSPSMRRMKEMLARVLDSPASVLVAGESGTGKELVARAIHFESARRDSGFVAENCAALPESLLESELFGHARGAYTGATHDKPGLFEAADGGTLFLDEIADTSPAVQAKLLRVLENSEIRRLGETHVRRVDVRIVAATSRDLMREVEEGRFRPELYYRLSVLTVDLPPLRERLDDVPLLAEHFLRDYARRTGKELPGLTPEVLAVLSRYAWPGNVRQLRNEVERMAALADPGRPLGFGLLSDGLRGIQPSSAEVRPGESLSEALERIRTTMIREALGGCDGNRTHAAARLGISRPNLQKMMRRLGVS